MEWKPIRDYKKPNREERVLLYKGGDDNHEDSQHTIVPGDMVSKMRDATHYIIIENPE